MFYVEQNQRRFDMQEKTSFEKYMEQDKICNEKVAIIQPFLKKISEENDEGTAFYNDVTVLSGPGVSQYNHIYTNRRDLFDRWKKGEISMYNIKWAGVTFVIEYRAAKPALAFHRWNPSNAFMVYKHNTQPVSLDIAKAVKDLYDAQEYRSVIYGAHREEIESALKQKAFQLQK